ncbi:hypothetical protein PVJ1_00044 [Psychrobacillus phage PVJ1]|nr:hypothetical protein PVJ1_00044 [Psychrobacillus phage PVJ1]
MNDEQKAKLYEIVDIMEGKAPREVLIRAIEQIQQMDSKQFEGLISLFELLNKHDVDINLFEETADQ